MPRLYRLKFGRDIFADIDQLSAAADGQDPEASTLDLKTLSIFEDVAYTMAKYADPAVPETPEEWLDGFDMFSIYLILPQIIELWRLNTNTQVASKKKAGKQPAR